MQDRIKLSAEIGHYDAQFLTEPAILLSTCVDLDSVTVDSVTYMVSTESQAILFVTASSVMRRDTTWFQN